MAHRYKSYSILWEQQGRYWNLPLLVVLIIAVSGIHAQPIPLVENSYRINNPELLFPLEYDSAASFWEVQQFSFSAYNSSYWSKDGYLKPNRLIIHAQDSIDYKKLNLTFRVRLDQIGHNATDASWKHDSMPNWIMDIEKLNLVITPNEYLQFGLGKDRFNWGPLELGGLLLSDYNQGFIALQQRYTLGPIVLRGIATELNSIHETDTSAGTTTHIKRYFSASKVEIYQERWGFALGQSVIYAGEGRSFELGYLFPFVPYHFVQLSKIEEWGNNGDNTFGSADFYVNWLDNKIELYGELLVDDFQASQNDNSQSIQNALGFMAGVRFQTSGGLFGFFEAGQINSYVYNHVAGNRLRSLYNDGMLATPLGPDNQLFWGQIGHPIGELLTIDFTGWYHRSGERTITTDYSYTTNAQNSRTDPIPYGTVQGELSGWITSSLQYKHLKVVLIGGVSHYFNKNHVPGTTATYPFLGITMQSGITIRPKKEDTP